MEDEDKEDVQVIVCRLCCEIFSTEEALDQHECPEATEEDNSEDETDETNDTPSNTTSSSTMFHCVPCRRVFANQIMYSNHVCKKRKPKRAYNCGMCGKCFEKACVLQVHMKIHYASKEFICNICSKAFLLEHQLKTHLVVHSNQRPFECDKCGMRFKRGSHLWRHQMVHTGEKTVACDKCDYKSTSKYAVKRHEMSVHTAERPFPCTQCPFAFSEKYKLNSHIEKAHGTKSKSRKPKRQVEMVKCLYCDKSFFWRKHLSIHLQSEHPEEHESTLIKTEILKENEASDRDPDYMAETRNGTETLNDNGSTRAPCLFCDKSFSRTTGLIRHMKVHHPQEYKNSKLNNTEN